MNQELERYLSAYDYRQIADEMISWLRGWFSENGPQSPAVIGISGGKDSTVVAALCARALGPDRVIGVLMPNQTQSDLDVAKKVVTTLGIHGLLVNIGDSYQDVLKSVDNADYLTPTSVITLSAQSKVNLGPRIRMATLYAISQSVNGRVSCNGNRSERFTGYFTIHGDGAGDFAPLANLTVTEVKLIGKALGVPDDLIEKKPSDGLTGKTDEDNYGFTYEMLDTYILTGKCEDENARSAMEKRHQSTSFKLREMPQFYPVKAEKE